MLIDKKKLHNAGETLEVWFDNNTWYVKKFKGNHELYFYIKDTEEEAMELFNHTC